MGEAEEGASSAYDIFINHRGPDTKKTVASLIYHRLNGYGLRVFIDKEEPKAEDPSYNKIKSAISSSWVHVAIFSVRYAESSWCLNELLDMLESGCKVVPIFYDVKPADLYHIMEGRYAYAFRNHQNNGTHELELVERWKDALQTASKISGTEFNTEKDDLGELVEKIVERVRNEPKWELLHVAEHPVGLHQATEDFNNFLKEARISGTTVVGIMGLGGSGKSTLVKHLYNCYLQSRKFKRYCFLAEFEEKNFSDLQQKLVRDLLGDDKYSISDTIKGKGKLQTCSRGCGPVLIVLDGLDKEEQIENLLLMFKKDVLDKEEKLGSLSLMKDALAEGSLILVTCHDKSLLAGHQVNLFYDVKLLQRKDAHDLLCWYAFDPAKPPKHLKDLVEKFLEICCGFPLALKVFGRKLSMDHDRRYWEEQLKDLSRPKFPKTIVDKILKVSYDCLEEKKKEAFLDVAHFLVGEDTDLAVRVLEGNHGSGLKCLRELQSKCLLDLQEIEHCKRPFAEGPCIQWRTKGSYKIKMHDLVRKMARQIAIEDSCPSPATKPLRLCQLDDKRILQQLQRRGYHVRGIRCEYIGEPERQDEDINKPPLTRWPWPLPYMDKPEMRGGKIYGLKFMVLHDFRVPFPSNRLSGDLIWLRMHESNWGNTIPTTLSLRNLRVLELDGVNFEALNRMEGDKFPSKLGELTVDYCGESAEIPKRNFPSSSRGDNNAEEVSSSPSGSIRDWFRFRQLTGLVKMVLKNVKGLKSLPIDLKALTNLRHLDLSGWRDLEKMPDSFTGLSQLQYLALQDCMRLSISDLGGITKLEYLDLEGCSSLQELPDKTTAQRELRYLNLMGTSIAKLPQNLGKLKNLEQLLIKSRYLTSLPHSFHELERLRILTLSGCPDLTDIASSISIEHFAYLESLQLWEVGVMTVPQGIEWSSVKVLHVKASHVSKFSFEMLPDCSPSEGNTDDGTQSVGATEHNRVSRLTELRLETSISKLRIPPEESLFPDFEIIDLSGSRSLSEVQSLPCNLRRLYLMNCPLLTTLPCLSNLVCVRILDISGCHKLKTLNLEGLRSIEEIAAKDCWNLQSIQGLAQLRTLSYLNVSTFNEVPNSTIWSEILGFPSNVSTVILGGANVLCMKAEEMDSLKQFIVKEFQGATIIDIPTIEKLHRVPLKHMELYGAVLFCFIAERCFIKFEVSVGDNIYSISGPSFVTRVRVHEEHDEETPWVYAFLWSQNSNMFKDPTLHDKSVLDCTVEGHSGTSEKSITRAWIVKIGNRTDGVKIYKQMLNSLCCIHQGLAS